MRDYVFLLGVVTFSLVL